ncbi:MAG: septum site-determining protein MinC [Firmicutes bacterium]|nr:septum site-determining protein MinC [Bacillota bacterium]
MSQELCSIKGSREGLVITISDASQFSEVIGSLDRQLAASQSFFMGASAKVFLRVGSLTSEQLDQLEQLIAGYGMHLDREPPSFYSSISPTTPVQDSPKREEDNTILVRRTIRSGQRLHYDGNVVVMGDVNAGAEVVCTGDIVVLGSLRGVAHAGAEGRLDATVFAFRLEPTQLRIAHLISRAPDEKVPLPEGPEIARIVENTIQLSIYNH